MPAPEIVVIDTTFARVDMGAVVVARLDRLRAGQEVVVTRHTVPGFKDLTAVARRCIDGGAGIVVACGMPGPEAIDEACAHDASAGLQMVQAMTGVSVLEVFVHTSEALLDGGAVDEDRLEQICFERCEGHAENAWLMLTDPASMVLRAGTGRRQGGPDVGAVGAGANGAEP